MARIRTFSRLVGVLEKGGWKKGKRTYQSHGIGNLGDDDLDGLNTLSLAQFVFSILLETAFGFVEGETREGVGSDFLGEVLVG